MAAYLLRTSPYEVWYRVVFNVFSTLQNCKITDEKIPIPPSPSMPEKDSLLDFHYQIFNIQHRSTAQRSKNKWHKLCKCLCDQRNFLQLLISLVLLHCLTQTNTLPQQNCLRSHIPTQHSHHFRWQKQDSHSSLSCHLTCPFTQRVALRPSPTHPELPDAMSHCSCRSFPNPFRVSHHSKPRPLLIRAKFYLTL